jgi:Zn-dependent M28 family amino/carboxypeptidase
MKRIVFIISITVLFFGCKAQDKTIVDINREEVERILRTLSSDAMGGRSALSHIYIEKAGNFIADEFKSIGLDFFDQNTSYKQYFDLKKDGITHRIANIVGVIPGKSLTNEYVIFSAHFDHIGIINGVGQDSIANGADDDASGVTAVIKLAKYFAAQKNNERTLIFVAFNAEELGGHGSNYFSKQLDPNKIVAMFNIEMIGKESKFGKNSAFITGYERSDFGKILNKSLKGSPYVFYKDPYPEQNLFYRSDNAMLAKLGVPAHTISTVQIDKDSLYHTVKDEIETLDIDNVTATIKAIATSATSIINGKSTPSRIK